MASRSKNILEIFYASHRFKAAGVIAAIVASGFLLLASSPFSIASDQVVDSRPVNYRLDEISPLVKQGYYTHSILKFLKQWPPPTLPSQEGQTFLRAIKTPGLPDTVGMIKHFVVKAPLEKAVEITERFEDYPKIWEEIVSVKVESRDRNRTVTAWTRKAPAFFLPKIEYRMLYVSDKSVADRVVYRQQLIDGNSLNASDGLIVLERLPTGHTQISVLNFFDAALGVFKPIVGGKIWQKSMEESYKDDVAFCTKLEHPDWSLKQISDAAEHALDQHPIDQVEYTDLLKFDQSDN